VAGAATERRRSNPLGLLPDISRAVLRRVLRPLRVAWRRNWFYRSLLKGRLPDRVLHHPFDALPRRLEEADATLKGRFRFAGETVDLVKGSIFDRPPPSAAWAMALHSFEWLAPLSAAGGEAARVLATRLISQWVARNGRYGEPAWLPQIMARRLIQLLAHGRFVIANSDMLWRSRLFVSLREQSRLLPRIVEEAPEGLPRLEAAAANVLAIACLDDQTKRLDAGLAQFEAQIAAQILGDGGHASRSPEQLLHAYRHIVMTIDALTAVGYPVPAGIRSAHDRIAPMLRFFRHGDGALALFNGGSECDGRMIAGLLARDDVRGLPFLHEPHSGFQRLTAGRALAIMDCGAPPEGALSLAAHAGCLSFEFSTGGQRLVVNCGAGDVSAAHWQSALRNTAAHSTVTLADTSTVPVLPAGWVRDLLGPRLVSLAAHIETERHETPHGWCVEAHHDLYLREFRIVHERRLTLSPHGTVLTGGDRLMPSGRGPHAIVPYAVRFHIHPDIRMSASQGGSVILKLPNGDGWRFRHGGPIAIEESVYLGRGVVRRSEQLVLAGEVKNEPVEIGWAFEKIAVE
jgi:uncharacterized heparinase superfamily protein